MRLINDDKVVVSPVDPIQRSTEGFAAGAGKIRVTEDVVVKPVAGKDIGLEVTVVVQPVIRQLLGTEHQN